MADVTDASRTLNFADEDLSSLEEFEESLDRISYKFDRNDSSTYYNLWILGEENFNLFIDLLKKHGQSFCVRSSRCTKKPRLQWSSQNIKYFKIPFAVHNIISKECIVGGQYWRKKSKNTSSHVTSNHSCGKQKQFRKTSSKKMDCAATLKIIEVICYPEYSMTSLSNNEEKKSQLMKKLKSNLSVNEEPIVTEKRFYISLTKPMYHTHSVLTIFLNQQLDDRLKEQVKRCLQDGITCISTIQTILKQYVKEKISKDIPVSSRSFFPNKKIIYNYVQKYTHETHTNIIASHSVEYVTDSLESLATESEYESDIVILPSEPSNVAKDLTSQLFQDCHLSKIQELAKSIYDTSFLITLPVPKTSSNDLGDTSSQILSLINQMENVCTLLSKFVHFESGSNIPVLSSIKCSELPQQKKQVKKCKDKVDKSDTNTNDETRSEVLEIEFIDNLIFK